MSASPSQGCITLLLAACAVLLAGCAGVPQQVAVSAPSAEVLPPLAKGLPALSGQVSQTLSAVFGERELTLSCGFSAEAASGWRTVCVNPLGLRVFTLGMAADGTLTAERGQGVPEQLDPARIAADVQLAYWPLPALEAAYANTRWRVTQPAPDTRRLWLDQRVVAEVHYGDTNPWNGRLWLVNLRSGYVLAIQSAPAAATQ